MKPHIAIVRRGSDRPNPAFNFTFALVEMSIFKLSGGEGLILCPRILVQTEMIQRAVVVISDHRVSVQLPATAQAKPTAITENITAAQFYDAMAKLDPSLPDKLRAFIGRLEPLGVYADFQKSLNFRWDPPEGRTVSLGYITPNGEVWTDTANYRVSGDLGHYIMRTWPQAGVGKSANLLAALGRSS
jgi:hypothetical protein